eukprot:CAMPEP_0178391178 /NCGR_PEP_ID=MMETSP0689_2-20121128/11030_1 /TAXON_ID=160604 /ORGANISM="Amphidinium massartii, Strain CS-259" /LENGTH=151 /DNA_ID=CAMNT_0020011715 /DNA_START=69 /DNA_END=520 /DNA_ORIENTATION=+
MSSYGELPRVIVFDLDGTLWEPEMYMIRGGSPFRTTDNGNRVFDRRGEEVELLGKTREILETLAGCDAVKDGRSTLAVASTCDEPEWARECLRLFRFREGKLTMSEILPVQEIYGAHSKVVHFERIRKQTGADYEDMIFLDNQMNNINAVA